MLLACLPFWGQTCEIPAHENAVFDAIVATKMAARRRTDSSLEELAWELDAARWRSYEGPAQCDCFNKHKLNEMLVKLYRNTPANSNIYTIWCCENDWDAPVPTQ